MPLGASFLGTLTGAAGLLGLWSFVSTLRCSLAPREQYPSCRGFPWPQLAQLRGRQKDTPGTESRAPVPTVPTPGYKQPPGP